jgi:tetratricopeptide (TPR) repeat protein
MQSASSAPDPNPAQWIPPAEVLEQLERILAHPLFQRSERLSTFLRYAVERTLAGEAATLKEFVIGAEAFQLGPSFDPQTDNIVRVNANRLRSKLLEYYHRERPSNPVVIDLPRGGYVPVFSYAQAPHGAQSAFGHPPSGRRSVGRHKELRLIQEAFAAASGGPVRMLTISGDAGMGKTTIVNDFLSGTESAQVPVWILRGCCSERLSKTDAFVPIFECMDELARGKSGPEAAQLMQQQAPLWYSLLASQPEEPPAAAREASPERMRREFVRFFESLSQLRPVILFLDDLHWADASTCDLLDYLGSKLKNVRIFVIATYRPSELSSAHPFLPVRLALESRGASQEVQLEYLTAADIAAYLQLRFPGHSFPPEFTDVVRKRTEGNPLFMREMLSFLMDRNILAERPGGWSVDRNTAEIRQLIPSNTLNMIRMQVDRFPSLDRTILQCGAVQGVEFDSAVIARALSLDPGEIEERLQALERVHRFVRSIEERDLAGTFSVRYRFVHVLYQNALYADLPPTRRAIHSLAVAQAVIALSGEIGRAAAAEVALLFETGRDWEQASQYFFRAARYAAGVFAYPEAVTLCQNGLHSLLSLPESRERDSRELEFLLILGMAQMATCGFAAPEVEATHRRSWALCLRLGEKRRLVRVLWGVHTCLVNAGQLVPALALAEEMRELAGALGDRASVTQSLHALGTTLAFMGKPEEARDALEQIFVISPVRDYTTSRALFALDPCVTSLSMLARVLARLGSLGEALEKATASVEIAGRLAHPQSLAYAVFWVGWVRHARQEYQQALEPLEEAMALSRTHGLPQILEWGRVVRGSCLAHLGRATEGIVEIRTSLDNQLAMRCLLERSYCLTLLAEALLRVNGYLEGLALCDESLKLAHDTQGHSYDIETERVREAITQALENQGHSDSPSSTNVTA